MALNYSRPHLFSDDNLISPYGIMNGYIVEGIWDKSGESSTMCWHRNLEQDQEKNSECFSAEKNSEDIVNLLPSDPFGMDIQTTFTAITGWLEDIEVNCNAAQNECIFYDKWDFFLNRGLSERSNFSGEMPFDEKKIHKEKGVEAGLDIFYTDFIQACSMFDIVGSEEKSGEIGVCFSAGRQLEQALCVEGAPHEAFTFVLSYLGVKDLLSVERVCKSLFVSVRNDPWLWVNIHIDQPLNERITDYILLKLVRRSQGELQCLSLVECPKVTDDGLRFVLDSNPQLTKLSVPGCTRISIECLVESIRAFNSHKKIGGIKHLRVGGLYGVDNEHFEELKLLLGVVEENYRNPRKQYFYHRGNFYLPYDDDRAIDIEMCPRCEKYRLVYDCPSEGCNVNSSQCCRACTLCIARCAQCGRCVNDTEFEETFCLELLCSECFKLLLNYHDNLDREDDSIFRTGKYF